MVNDLVGLYRKSCAHLNRSAANYCRRSCFASFRSVCRFMSSTSRGIHSLRGLNAGDHPGFDGPEEQPRHPGMLVEEGVEAVKVRRVVRREVWEEGLTAKSLV